MSLFATNLAASLASPTVNEGLPLNPVITSIVIKVTREVALTVPIVVLPLLNGKIVALNFF